MISENGWHNFDTSDGNWAYIAHKKMIILMSKWAHGVVFAYKKKVDSAIVQSQKF